MNSRRRFLPFLAILLLPLWSGQAQEADVSSGAATESSSSSGGLSLSGEGDASLTSLGDESEGGDGFFFPGGYGYLPETISSLGGLDLAPPMDFYVSLSQSYNDNIYNRGRADRKGSWITNLNAGTSIVLSNQRLFLTLSGNVGLRYYWNIDRESVRPVGRLSMATAYKVTPRLLLTFRLSGGYYDQPDFNRVGVPARANDGSYFDLNGHFGVDYQWAPRFSTSTTLGFSTLVYQESSWHGSNYLNLNLGQAFRFQLSPLYTAVLEGRFGTTKYRDSIRDSNSQYALAGVDFQLSPRLTGSVRGGAEFRQFSYPGYDDQVSPFAEVALGYRFAQGSHLYWFNRFGFEDGVAAAQSNKSFRTGFQVTHVFTPRISLRFGGTYSYQTITDLWNDSSYDQQLLSGNVGVDYTINRNLKLYTTYTINGVIYDYNAANYHRNEVSFGASFHF